MLRDANGNKVHDPVTGEGRRVDHAVIDRDANTAKTYRQRGIMLTSTCNRIKKDESLTRVGHIFETKK